MSIEEKTQAGSAVNTPSPTSASRVESALAILQQAVAHGPAVFSSSYGAEDMVLSELIHQHRLPIRSFTLDTGRLPEETYRLMQRAEIRYGAVIQLYFPQSTAVQRLVAKQGINGFYDSIEARKACCAVRKLEPLGRALEGASAWVTGQRSAQSETRADLTAQQWDESHQVTKFNPLHDWAEADVWAFLKARGVPYNELHDRQYPSIGCAPCTRAIAAGEHPRAGRWWWEQAESRECGLHSIRKIA